MQHAALAFSTSRPRSPAVESRAELSIAAPAETVWRLLTHFDDWPRWNPAIASVRMRDGLVAGSVFVWRSQGLTVTSTLTEVDGPRRLAWTGRAFGTRATHDWTIEPAGDGVVVRTGESFDGWLPRLMPDAMRRKLDDTLTAWLRHLKAAAETAPE